MENKEIAELKARIVRWERSRRRERLLLLIVVGVALAVFARAPGIRGAGQNPGRAIAEKGDRPSHELHERVPEEPRPPLTIAADRRAMSFQALEMMHKTGRRGNPIANQPMDIYQWSVRMLGAEIYMSMTEDETRVEDPEVYLALPNVKPNAKRLDAFRAHWERMKAWEDRIRPVVRAGALSKLGFLEYEFRRLQAELWLAREIEKSEKAE